MKLFQILNAFAFFAILQIIFVAGNFLEFKKWNLIDFKYPTPAARQHAINDKSFIPENIIPIDVAVEYRGDLK